MSDDIPTGWRVVELDQILESAVDGPFGSSLKTEHYVTEPGVRVIRLQNLGDGRFLDEDRVFVTDRRAAGLHRHEVLPGDLLVASLGDETHPVARSCLYPADGGKAIVKADCFRLRFIAAKAEAAFVRHALNSRELRTQFGGLTQGATRDRINLSSLERFRLALPTVGEQRQITEFLDGVDEAIRSTERLVAKLEQAQQGILEDLLSRGVDESGRLRQPGSHFKNTEIGSMPNAWSVADIGSISSGKGEYGSLAAARSFDPDLPRYVRITDIDPSGLLRQDSRASISELDAAPYVLRQGDLCFARSGATVGKTYLYAPSDGRCAFAGYVIKFSIETTVARPGFVWLWTRGQQYAQWVAKIIQQGAQPNINARVFSGHKVPLPPLAEQAAIVEHARSSITAIFTKVRLLAKLREAKKGLTDDLLTGRVRVAEVKDTIPV